MQQQTARIMMISKAAKQPAAIPAVKKNNFFSHRKHTNVSRNRPFDSSPKMVS